MSKAGLQFRSCVGCCVAASGRFSFSRRVPAMFRSCTDCFQARSFKVLVFV